MRERARTEWTGDGRRPLWAALAALWLAVGPAATLEAAEPDAPTPAGAPALDLTFDPQSVTSEETKPDGPSRPVEAPASAFDPSVPLDGPLLQRRGVEAGVQGGDRAGAYATLGPGPLKSTAELAAPRLDGSAGPDAPEARLGARLDQNLPGAQALHLDAGALWRLEPPLAGSEPDAASTAPLLDLRTGLSVTDGLSVEGDAQVPASGETSGPSAASDGETRLKSKLMMRYNLDW